MNRILKMSLVAVMVLAFSGCGMKAVINQEMYSTVKDVAVITYTVPEKIVLKKDPKENKKSIGLADVVGAILEGLNGDGTKAATIAHESFTNNINSQGLSFNVMSKDAMMAKADFVALYKPAVVEEAEPENKLAKYGSLLGLTKAGPPQGVAPERMNQFGLAVDWNNGTALMRTAEEKEYISKAVAALGVDAVILINDPGFSFACEFCIGGTGAATTGSAFLITMVNGKGEIILDMREYFLTTDEQAALVAGVINPLEVDDLFKEHGKKAAIVFADYLKETLAKAQAKK